MKDFGFYRGDRQWSAFWNIALLVQDSKACRSQVTMFPTYQVFASLKIHHLHIPEYTLLGLFSFVENRLLKATTISAMFVYLHALKQELYTLNLSEVFFSYAKSYCWVFPAGISPLYKLSGTACNFNVWWKRSEYPPKKLSRLHDRKKSCII